MYFEYVFVHHCHWTLDSESQDLMVMSMNEYYLSFSWCEYCIGKKKRDVFFYLRCIHHGRSFFPQETRRVSILHLDITLVVHTDNHGILDFTLAFELKHQMCFARA